MEEENTNVTVDSLTEWKNEPTLAMLKRDYEESLPYHNAEVKKISRYIDNLNGKLKHKPLKNRSKVVPKLIRKQAEWRYSSLESPFLETSDLFNVKPTSADDGPLAEQIGSILNNQFCIQMDAVDFYNKYTRALVNTGTAILKVGWIYREEERKVSKPTYVLDPFTQEPILGDDGQPMQNGMESHTETIVVEDRPTIEVIEFENVVFDPTCKGKSEKAAFVIERFTSSLSELKQEGGYKNLDKIVFESEDSLETSEERGVFDFNDNPRRRIEIIEMWLDWDTDGDGITTPIVATWAGNTLIKLEENPFPDKQHPFVTVQYLPVSNQIAGEPDGVLIEEDQDILGAVTRGVLDIMGRSANGQIGVRSDAMSTTNFLKYQNNEDFMFQPGVRPEEAFFTGKYPEIPTSAFQMIDRANQNAESLTGIQAFNQGMNGSGLGDTARSVQSSMNAAAKRELGILRRMTSGIKKVARKVTAMNAIFLEPDFIERLTGKPYVHYDDHDVSAKLDVQFSISTAEEDETRAKELSFMIQTIGQSIDSQMLYFILSKIAKLRKMPELAKMLEEYKPTPNPQAEKKVELEIQEMQGSIKKLNVEMDVMSANEMLILAKTNYEKTRTEKTESETDIIDQQYLDKEDGEDRIRDIEDKEMEHHTAMAKANNQQSINNNMKK